MENYSLILFLILTVVLLLAIIVWKRRNLYKSIIGASDIIKNLRKSPRTKSEQAVINYFEEFTKLPFPSVLPDWLVYKGKRLELDGFCKELNIALEFSGPLHTKWYPEKESYKTYFKRIIYDIAKKRICAQHGVRLITVDVALPSKHWRTYVESRLFDIGFLKERPINYISEQIAEPYRQPQLEKELDLTRELDEVNSL
jgi:hypothetical protein